MAESQGGISKLLSAETAAQEIVNKARKAKQQRLRQAQYEAAAEVAVYRAAREESYRKLVSGHTGDAGATSKQLEEEGGKAIAAQNASVKKSGDAVVGFLVAAVTKC